MLLKKKKGGGQDHSACAVFPPRRIGKSPLFRKYFIMLTALLLVITCLAGALMSLITSRQYKKQELASLLSYAEDIAGLSGDLLSVAGGGDYIADYENALTIVCYTIKNFSENSDTDIFMTNPDGDVVICKELLDLGNEHVQDGVCTIHSGVNIPKETLNGVLSGEKTSYIGRIDGIAAKDLSVAASPIYVTGVNRSLTGYIFITRDNAESLRNSIRSIQLQFLVSLLFSILLAICIIYYIIYRFARPLQEILYATRLYAKGDFSYRISEGKGNDEMQELTRAFNSMANDLSAIENSRRNFVANVSHELKTPMTTIGGFIDGILDGTIPASQHKKYLSIVSDEVRRLSRLISSMLNMSKIEAGELTPSFTGFDLTDMIVRTFLSFEQIISQHNINITGLDTMGPITVSADPDMINQVIYNIIDNAVKFTPDGGEISVHGTSATGKAVVRIRNYGVGIANDELKMVFDRFYKVDKSRSLNTKSVGLGLYICKNIIELHNGRIYATSKENEYTEFTIELPLRQNG